MSLGGNVCVRDGNKLDYCWKEAIQSLLPVVDVCVVCDGGSTDGTLEEIRAWCEREPKLRLCCYPWTDPSGDIEFWVKWLNFAREHIPCTHQIQLDADEVLDDESYREIRAYVKEAPRASLVCKRLNYWRDLRHTIPPGVCLSHRPTRLCPTDVWLPSDGAHPLGAECTGMSRESGVVIHHYGFLRRPEAYFAKQRLLQRYFFGGDQDKRLEDVEVAIRDGGKWMDKIQGVEWSEDANICHEKQPIVAHQWLRERGFNP